MALKDVFQWNQPERIAPAACGAAEAPAARGVADKE